ncbi:hypothetical protein EYH65_12555 [Bacillus subtilis]|nr:hypothetical protein [Bacillus subtilis]
MQRKSQRGSSNHVRAVCCICPVLYLLKIRNEKPAAGAAGFFVAKDKTISYDIPSCRCEAMLYLNGNDLTVQEGFGTLYKCFIF